MTEQNRPKIKTISKLEDWFRENHVKSIANFGFPTVRFVGQVDTYQPGYIGPWMCQFILSAESPAIFLDLDDLDMSKFPIYRPYDNHTESELLDRIKKLEDFMKQTGLTRKDILEVIDEFIEDETEEQ